MRVGAHPEIRGGGQPGQLGHEPPLGVEQLPGPVAPHPRLELPQVLGVLAHLRQRHLVGAERPLDRHPVDHLGPGPPLRGAQHDRGPPGPPGSLRRHAAPPRVLLHGPDGGDAPVEGRREVAVHGRGVAAGHHVGLVAVPGQDAADLVVAGAAEHRRARDLVAVQVEDRQHGAVAHRVEEADALPGALERPGLRLAVADHAGDEQVGVVERGPEGVHERVAELAALVDRAGHVDADVARHAARGRELAEQAPQAVGVRRDRRVDLRVGPLQVDVGEDGRAAVPGAGDEHDARAGPPDHPVQVRVDEVQPRGRPPVAEQARLDVLGPERLAQQWVVL